MPTTLFRGNTLAVAIIGQHGRHVGGVQNRRIVAILPVHLVLEIFVSYSPNWPNPLSSDAFFTDSSSAHSQDYMRRILGAIVESVLNLNVSYEVDPDKARSRSKRSCRPFIILFDNNLFLILSERPSSHLFDVIR